MKSSGENTFSDSFAVRLTNVVNNTITQSVMPDSPSEQVCPIRLRRLRQFSMLPIATNPTPTRQTDPAFVSEGSTTAADGRVSVRLTFAQVTFAQATYFLERRIMLTTRLFSQSCNILLLISLITPATFAQDDATSQATAALKALGGNVMKIAQSDPRLDVTLHLADQEINDDALAHVAKLPQVAWLNLAGTKITDAGLAHLSGLSELEKLHLERTQIGDAGLAHLAKLEKLVYLNLYGTPVTDAGLQHLHGIKSLKRIYLWQSQATEAGIAALREALPEARIVAGVELKPVEPPQEEKPEEEKKE